VKSKSIGSLILLAILAPSCGGGKPAAPIVPPPPARWSSQYATPTTVNLTSVKFANANQGIVAGEAGTFIRTNDGGVTWTQEEYTPANRGGDILAMGVYGIAAVAVGADWSSGGSAAWISTDAIQWFNTEEAVYPPTRFPQPWVDVSVVPPISGPASNASYRLRPTGLVDFYQGGYSSTADSTANVGGGTTPWDSNQALGIQFFVPTGPGYVCGSNGGKGQIRRTIDTDAATWSTMTITSTVGALRRLFMFSTNSGFACGDAGALLLTSSGNSWDLIPGVPSVNLRGISFPMDTSTGWVVGENGAIYKLTFSSPNWTITQQGAGLTTEHLNDVSFVDSNTGYAVGTHGTVLKCTGGSTWTVISGPTAPPLPGFNAVDFSSDGMTGLAVGNGGLVQRTLDGGSTWLSFNTGVGGTNLTGVCIPRSGSGNVAYACGPGTVLTQTTLKGAASSSWTSQTIAAGNYSAILFPADDAKGVVVGSAGELLMTTNSGTTWAAPGTPPPTPTNYRAICSGGTKIFAAGDNGIVINSDYSSPAGATVWANSPTLPGGTPPQVLSIQAPMGTGHSLFAGAADGKVYRLDSAMTGPWDGSVAAIQGGTNPVASIAFSNDTSGLAVVQGASNGGVFYTLDGGATWTRSYLHVKIGNGPPPNQLREIRMIGPSVGWAVGDGGMILKTATGGQ
jgi:photosystem II stability/assembly factor-like uncharacterized protein